MKFRRALVAAITAALSLSAVAQESRTETQAIRCSAVYFVMTGVTEGHRELGEHFTAMAQYYGGLYGRERNARTRTVTNGEVLQRREAALKEFAATHANNPALAQKEALFCMTWTDGIRAQNAFDEPQIAWPSGTSEKIKKGLAPVVTTAFDLWAEGGYLTPHDVRKQIERSIGR